MPEEIVRVNEANQKSDRLEKQVATPADFTIIYSDTKKYNPYTEA